MGSETTRAPPPAEPRGRAARPCVLASPDRSAWVREPEGEPASWSAAVCAVQGKCIGRPMSLTPERRAEAVRRLQAGESVSAVARTLGTSRQSVTRVRDGAAAVPDPAGSGGIGLIQREPPPRTA